jgi:NADH-quinone oxidoreductase subunit G
VADAGARVDTAAVWDVPQVPATPGRSAAEILAAARQGKLSGLVFGGVDLADLPDPVSVIESIESVGFVVALEVRTSAVTERADVVLPVAPPSEKAGTFLNWEGRARPFPQALASTAMADHRALDALAHAMGVGLGLRTIAAVHAELDQFGSWGGARIAAPTRKSAEPPTVAVGEAVLASWHLMIDAGRLQAGEPYLAGTARRTVARISAVTATASGLVDGALVRVSTDAGAITVPVAVTSMPDYVLWLPTNAPDCAVRSVLRCDAGDVVRLAPAGTTNDDEVTK